MKYARHLIVAMAVAVFISAPALAERNDAAVPPASPEMMEKARNGDRGERPQMNEEERTKRFAEHKAKALDRISRHIDELQKKKACVQSAGTPDALQACFPNRDKLRNRMHGGAGEGHPGAEGAGRADPAE